MRDRAFNYTAIKNKDTRIYAINGTKISSGGISVTFLLVAMPSFILFTFLGVAIDKVFNLHAYSLSIGTLNYILYTSGLGMVIGIALYYVKIHNYRLYQYLFARVLPKHIYTNSGYLAKRLKYYKIHIVGKVEGWI